MYFVRRCGTLERYRIRQPLERIWQQRKVHECMRNGAHPFVIGPFGVHSENHNQAQRTLVKVQGTKRCRTDRRRAPGTPQHLLEWKHECPHFDSCWGVFAERVPEKFKVIDYGRQHVSSWYCSGIAKWLSDVIVACCQWECSLLPRFPIYVDGFSLGQTLCPYVFRYLKHKNHRGILSVISQPSLVWRGASVFFMRWD